jgi:hypothetical protein
VLVFVMARVHGDQTDSTRGSVRPGPHGVEAVYTLNGELYRSQWFAAEALARADLATHHDALAAGGWTPVPLQSRLTHRWRIRASTRMWGRGRRVRSAGACGRSGIQITDQHSVAATVAADRLGGR